jgi:4'-phosphopantetheinyl transferase
MRIEIFLYDLSAALSEQVWLGTQADAKALSSKASPNKATPNNINPNLLAESLLHPDDAKALSDHPERRLLQRVSRYYRRKLLATALNQAPNTLVFSQTAWGKPTILYHEQLGFNQSHSQSMYSLAWSHEVAHLGIDIEDKSRAIKPLALAQRILTAAEYQYFLQAHDPQAYILKLWTIKEAVLKAAGLGIRLNLNALETNCETVQQQRGVARHPQIGRWDYACYALAQHLLCVSWPAQSDSTKIQVVFSHASTQWQQH